MVETVLEFLAPRPGGRYVDGTVGDGGHAQALLEATAPDGRVLGIDRDPIMVARAARRLAPFGERIMLVHGDYRNLTPHITEAGWVEVDGVLLDLGLSSYHLETAERGFSFAADGPLDMRYDPAITLAAREIVNTWAVKDLAALFREHGEGRDASRIARAIGQARTVQPLERTGELSDLIVSTKGVGAGGIHPATRVFQALRCAVNDELSDLGAALETAADRLVAEGRLVVISFHSLEDRIVKETFRGMERGCICPPVVPVCRCGRAPKVVRLTKKPRRPSDAEVEANRRARSARLRACEKLAA
ncbi:MAG: 16S rRNA (cytosine(1402)-N(4))-methyltransferase RsmH [Nitrospinae bacterium]|nr:16S rRNA (cytosine(1402)-N(4))-methyltransferase RsmH [Nitrospinota bacterium]